MVSSTPSLLGLAGWLLAFTDVGSGSVLGIDDFVADVAAAAAAARILAS